MIHRFLWNTLVRLSALVLLTSTMPASALSIGEPLPSMSLQSLDGRTHSMDAYQGKVLVLYLMGYA